MRPVLEVENLTFAYDSALPILQGVSFSVFPGECAAIVGANAAGKSTLLWSILGLLDASGTVNFFDEKIGKRNRTKIGVVFQNPEDQLFMPRLIDDLTLPLVNRGLPHAEALRKAHVALEAVGLRDVAHRPASRLSLGERKRAAIAAALATSPELLLLDEPTAELDGRAVRQLASLLREITVARVIVTHDLEFVRDICRRVLVLAGGRIVADGPTKQVLSDQALLEQAGLV